jgi:O-antigen/teichoic acid export membrane protein
LFKGDSIKARSLRGTALTAVSFGGTNLLRLLSNLVLTRILFPEAFGLMALVQVFIVGLSLFSDTGVKTSIIQNKRGDDPAFLNTAWTIQIVRGFMLWLAACVIAIPAAQLYDQPMLLQILPIAGLNQVISGFATTNVATANRHIFLGRLTSIDLMSQAIGITITVILAYLMGSVWALVYGSLVSSILKVAAQHVYLPGIRNRLHYEKNAFRELFSFGRFIFLSTAVTFVMSQGDKAILGTTISITELGIYNIGYFLGSLPLLLCTAASTNVIMPLYRIKPIGDDPDNRAKVFRARRLVVGGSIILCWVMGLAGIALVDLMYDDRYKLAGPIVVLLSLTLIPRISIASYGGILLAAGDSRRFFQMNFTLAGAQTILMLIGAYWMGIFGVIIAYPISTLVTHPLRVKYIKMYSGWDPQSDGLFMIGGMAVSGLICWLHWTEILQLIS